MRPLALSLLLPAAVVLIAQDPSIKDGFQQAKALWSTQGNREEASAKFEKVVEALAPKGPTLTPEWQQVLCETYNWLAVLDDRNPATKAKARTRFESLIALNPDFEVDRAVTSQKLVALFESLRAEKLSSVKLTLVPEGGSLQVDGKPAYYATRKYLSFGSHRVAYSKPGFTPTETTVELGAKESKSLELKLTRVSSTLSIFASPSGAEVVLDGKSLGRTKGMAGPETQALAAKANLKPEDLSEGFLISDLKAGEHTLEIKAPCYRTKILKVGKELTDPMADHVIEPVKLEAAKGLLSLTSPWEGGELLLNGQSYGNLPLERLPVCAGTYDLLVRFPSGGYSAKIEIQDGKTIQMEARPRPRLAFLGLDSAQDFTGRARILGLLNGLGEKLSQVAFLTPKEGESPKDALARFKASKEAELFLLATPMQDKVIHQLDLTLSTLEGEEEHYPVKPLEADPLGPLMAKLNALPPFFEVGMGVSLMDVAGEPGPYVLFADPIALKAGVLINKPLLQLNGKPSPTVLATKPLFGEAKGDKVSLAQGGAPINVALQRDPLEIPMSSSAFAYPFLISHLRLQLLGARGEEAAYVKLNLALALMHFRKYDKALELLRDTKLSTTRGVSQGTLDFYTGICFLKLGGVYLSEAGQAFRSAMKAPQATLFGPDGPAVAPLAKAILDDMKL